MKTLKSWLVVLIGCVVLVGCGGDQPAVEVTKTTQSPDPPASLVGTSVTNFPDTGLIDQDSTPVSFEGLPDKPVMISFIFTRCPMRSMCPRVTDNMATIQENINKEGERPAHFVLVTFDPEYDRPEILRNYATKYGINFQNFSLWTGEPSTIEQLTDRFNIMVMKTEDGIKTHNMKTFLIDRNGTIRHQFRSSDWGVQEVTAPLMRMISGG